MSGGAGAGSAGPEQSEIFDEITSIDASEDNGTDSGDVCYTGEEFQQE
jgi:hypothetical protein